MAAAAREEEEASPAQRLVEAALRGDVAAVEACLADADADADLPAASCVGVARLRVRCAEVALREAAAGEVVVESRELKTDVSPLFAAAHAGHADVIRALLVWIGAQIPVTEYLLVLMIIYICICGTVAFVSSCYQASVHMHRRSISKGLIIRSDIVVLMIQMEVDCPVMTKFEVLRGFIPKTFRLDR